MFQTRPERSPGRFKWTTQLCFLIGYANNLDFSRVTGKNCGSIYSIEATFDSAATDDQVRSMVQALLTDRFKMRSHRGTIEVDGYGLILGKGGLKIKEADPSADPPPLPDWVGDASPALKSASYISLTIPRVGVAALTARRVSMSQLAETLRRPMGMPVWDKTGLSGNYYFAFLFAFDAGTEIQADAPALPTALRETLGLQLEKQKGPLESVVIDSIEEPSEN